MGSLLRDLCAGRDRNDQLSNTGTGLRISAGLRAVDHRNRFVPPRGGCLLVGTDGLLDVRVFNGSTPSSLSIGLGDVLGGSDVRGGITGPPTCVSTTDPASNAHSGGRMDCFFRNGRYYLERITLSFNSKGTLVNFPRVELWSKACTGCPGTIRYSW